MTFEIRINTAGSYFSQSNHVVGEISVKCHQIWFPEKNWSDFPVVVLSWWLDAFLRLINSETAKEDFDFMDGPHNIEIKRKGQFGLYLSLLDYSDEVRMNAEVDIYGVFQALIKAAKTLIADCEQNGWVNDDLNYLKTYLKKMEAFEKYPERWK